MVLSQFCLCLETSSFQRAGWEHASFHQVLAANMPVTNKSNQEKNYSDKKSAADWSVISPPETTSSGQVQSVPSPCPSTPGGSGSALHRRRKEWCSSPPPPGLFAPQASGVDMTPQSWLHGSGSQHGPPFFNTFCWVAHGTCPRCLAPCSVGSTLCRAGGGGAAA